jgi:hypothetical protein
MSAQYSVVVLSYSHSNSIVEGVSVACVHHGTMERQT